MVKLLFTSTPRPLLLLPDLVLITITPLAALEPYSADAAAPFNTLMLSISSGLTKPAPLPKSTSILPRPLAPTIELLIGTPSITYKG